MTYIGHTEAPSFQRRVFSSVRYLEPSVWK